MEMNKEESFCCFYICYQDDGQINTDKLNFLVKSLSGSLRLAKTSFASYIFIIFDNPIPKSAFSSIEIHGVKIDQLVAVPEIHEADHSSLLYLTNLPDDYNNIGMTSNLNSFLNILDNSTLIEDKIPGILKTVVFTSEKSPLNSFLPHVVFSDGIKANITSNPLHVPLICVSNLPPNFQKREFSLFKCPYAYTKCEFVLNQQPNTPKTAYLSYSSNDEANKAVDFFNFAQIDNYDITAHHFYDKKIKDMKKWEIRVKHISPESKPFDLWSRFKIYGPILKAEISNKPNSAIYGTVQFYEFESAKRAIQDIQSQESSLVLAFTLDFIITIYNIDPFMKPEDVASLFSSVSKVDINSTTKKGLMSSATITFLTTQAAQSCLNSNTIHNGVRLLCKKGTQNSEQKDLIKHIFDNFKKSNTIKIKGINKSYPLQSIADLCSPFGVIRYLSNVDDVVVSYETEDECIAALQSLQAKEVDQEVISVEILNL